MAAGRVKECVVCNKVFQPNEPTKSIALTPRNMEETYYEIMSYVFQRAEPNKELYKPFTPVKPKYIESRVICQVCGVTVKDAYMALRKINNFISVNSYVQRHFISADKQDAFDTGDVGSSSASVVRASNESYMARVEQPHTPVKQKMKVAYEEDDSRKSMLNTMQGMICEEMQVFSKYTSLRNPDLHAEGVSEISMVSELTQLSPAVLKVLYGLTNRTKTQENFSTFTKTVACVAAFSQSERCNALQKMIGLLLYRDGASRKLYKILNALGISVSYDTVIDTVDSMRKDLDGDLQKWKQGVENFDKEMRKLSPRSQQNPQDVSHLNTIDFPEGFTPLGQIVQQGSFGGQFFRASAGAQMKMNPLTGHYYSVTFSFDNLNKHVVPRHYSSATGTVVMNMTSAFATFSRIPIPWTELNSTSPVRKYTSLPIQTWLPSQADFEVVKYDFKREVRKILVKHISIFQQVSSSVETFTVHKHTKESNYPSTFVPLGLLNVDENTTTGMLEIVNKFKRYAPEINQGEKVPIVAFGDGLSTDRMRSAQENVLNADSFSDLSLELVPGNSAWHKRVLLLNDDFKDLMPDTSKCKSQGTLAHFRIRFGHVKASSTVDRSFNHSYTLLKFSSYAYILAYAAEYLKLEENCLDAVPESLQGIQQDKKALVEALEKIVEDTVNFFWHDIERSITQDRYCVCDTEWDASRIKEYVGCDYRECYHKLWYHKSCLLQVQGTPGNTLRKPPVSVEKKWYCSADCAKAVGDKKFLYSKAMMFVGILHESFKSAIKQNDGTRMQMYNKLHLVQFCNSGAKHSMYLRIYHRILALMVNGPPSVKNDLINNSTINFKGYPGGNLSMDFVNEVFNKILKENLNLSKGNLTPEVVERRGGSVWSLSEIRREALEELNAHIAQSRSKEFGLLQRDLQDAVRVISSNRLLTFSGNRFHEGLSSFEYARFYIDGIEFFREEMTRQSDFMDNIQTFMGEERTGKKRLVRRKK